MTLNFGTPMEQPVADRPHPILDLLCTVPICRHAVRDHAGYRGPCAECWATNVPEPEICRGVLDRRRQPLQLPQRKESPRD